MKLYMKSLMLLLFLGTVASCNDSFLDQTQTSDLNRETVFADSTYTANFLTGIIPISGLISTTTDGHTFWLMVVGCKALVTKLNFILRQPSGQT